MLSAHALMASYAAHCSLHDIMCHVLRTVSKKTMIVSSISHSPRSPWQSLPPPHPLPSPRETPGSTPPAGCPTASAVILARIGRPCSSWFDLLLLLLCEYSVFLFADQQQAPGREGISRQARRTRLSRLGGARPPERGGSTWGVPS